METRAKLIETALRVVSTLGSRALTLDAVARAAGVSKGGLLYHFATKKALIEAMIQQAVDAFDQAIANSVMAGGDWLQAYVEETWNELGVVDPLSGVLTAVAEEPELVEPFKRALNRWYQHALAEYGPDALPLLLALDALWLHVKLGTLPLLDHEVLKLSLRTMAQACTPKGKP